MKPGERIGVGGLILLAIIFIYNFPKLILGATVLFILMYGLGLAADKIDQKIDEKYDDYQ